mmetsp:Transcript_19842/g.32543  ORF Transcript_19842/g.32543 Transcript_19842/m.32543 type:complete len:509 (-) Transcript_19842:420-1946(-)|eukprot:CAMPEP_0184647426 /NCGR_PEP_ID=MMETSP0308-20130426/4348_1 /TAXON_ID=38269 /ORGANISM="Gloeochaete witrockiana, Strain SAG 46.84" /LENGTH=508 /DNA_ID=CAMNT_0027078363 /DNA_START=43 /DNA_END=1569 /DNA_ORIENTATION=+
MSTLFRRKKEERPRRESVESEGNKGGRRLSVDSTSTVGSSVAEKDAAPDYNLVHAQRIHATRSSLLSSEASSHSYRGILNVGIILLVMSNFRLAMDNIHKYGILVDFVKLSFLLEPRRWPATTATVCLNVFMIISYLLERWAASFAKRGKRPPEVFIALLHTLNVLSLLISPVIMIFTVRINPAAGMLMMLFDTIFFMKLISYVFVNRELRRQYLADQAVARGAATTAPATPGPSSDSSPERRQSEGQPHGVPGLLSLRYPENVTLSNLLFFIAVPTLCYELNFPRAQRIRKGFLVRHILQFCFFVLLIYVIADQYLVVGVRNSLRSLQRKDPLAIAERVVKLAVPNLYVWLLGFYCYFHLFLNIMAELTRFGDRLFYKDWWNSTTIDHFWRTWNLPVHNFMVRHIFYPLKHHGFSRSQSAIVIFLISGLFHELLISIPFRTFKLWAVVAMLAQIPLAHITRRYFKDRQIGNVIFWLSIMLGQPMLVLFYYGDYTTRHPPEYSSSALG